MIGTNSNNNSCNNNNNNNINDNSNIGSANASNSLIGGSSSNNSTIADGTGISGSVGSCSGVGTGSSSNNNSPLTLRNVMAEHHLQYQQNQSACPYEQLVLMIRDLDMADDAIVMSNKIRKIELQYCHMVLNEDMLSESIAYINNAALEDRETSTKFAMLFSSHNFERLAMQETKVRSAMLKVLETNFLNAEHFRTYNRDRLLNSITLLGEYYNRVRLADNNPITILGESLLSLLITEVEQKDLIDTKLARVILTQVTMNGENLRQNHRVDFEKLLYHLRRHLIEQSELKAAVKALLLMTIDLCYTSNLSPPLEEMYTKYLYDCDNEDMGNNNLLTQHNQQQQSPQQQQLQSPSVEVNDSYDKEPVKKWSEQVCEDSFYESEFGKDYNGDCTPPNSNSHSSTENSLPKYEKQQLVNDKAISHNNTSPHNPFKNENSAGYNTNNRQRGGHRQQHQQHQFERFGNERSPRQRYNSREEDYQDNNEERDQSKPLPRWRNPRFNRDTNGEQQQRSGARSFQQDDDHHSVRSENGSLRLYSVGDRLRHSQEKMDRSSNSSNYSHIANWDHHSQRDDRSERSYVSNYERGSHGRNARYYNNRHAYDKPPRFLKNQQHQQQNYQQQHRENTKIHSDSWRRSNNNVGYGGAGNVNGGNSAELHGDVRASTLPRPNKNYENYNHNNANNYRRSQSPYHAGGGGGDGTYRNHRHSNQRYGSHNSLCSDNSASQQQHDRRGGSAGAGGAPREHWNPRKGMHQRPQRQPHQQQQQQKRDDSSNIWKAEESVAATVNNEPSDDTNSELVRNARQTTNYMNYLSSQK